MFYTQSSNEVLEEKWSLNSLLNILSFSSTLEKSERHGQRAKELRTSYNFPQILSQKNFVSNKWGKKQTIMEMSS